MFLYRIVIFCQIFPRIQCWQTMRILITFWRLFNLLFKVIIMTYHMDISSWVLTSLKNLNDAVGYNDGIEEVLLLGGRGGGGLRTCPCAMSLVWEVTTGEMNIFVDVLTISLIPKRRKKANEHDVCNGIIRGMVGVRGENDRFTSNGRHCKRYQSL